MRHIHTHASYTQVSVAKAVLPDDRRHFDVVVACEDEEENDIDVPLVSIKYK
jgi:ubiquitin-activating enzyme E1